MSQPEWKVIEKTDSWLILVDKNGVYEPEIEVAEFIEDVPEGSPCYDVFRVPLAQQKEVRRGNYVYMVPYSWRPDWTHPLSTYEEWYVDDLDKIAESAGTEEQELREALCSPDPRRRAWAYQAIAGHWGWQNFDQYPLRLTEEELEERWK